jgi:hypothetical protein
VKKIILCLFIIVSSLSFPTIGTSAYIIHLKNGGRFLTPLYWEEKHHVWFYVTGGTMGIGKDTVRKIEQSAVDAAEFSEVKTPEKRPAQGDPKASVSSAPQADAPKKDKKEDTKDDPKKDPNVMQDLNRLEKRFASLHALTIAELTDLKNDLTVLRDTLMSNYPEEEYRNEVTKVRDMRFSTNAVLVKKSKKR